MFGGFILVIVGGVCGVVIIAVPVGSVLSVSMYRCCCFGFVIRWSVIVFACVMFGVLCVMSVFVFCVICFGICVVLLVAIVIFVLYFLYSRYACIIAGWVVCVCFM